MDDPREVTRQSGDKEDATDTPVSRSQNPPRGDADPGKQKPAKDDEPKDDPSGKQEDGKDDDGKDGKNKKLSLAAHHPGHRGGPGRHRRRHLLVPASQSDRHRRRLH